jgi:hypothetical protein
MPSKRTYRVCGALILERPHAGPSVVLVDQEVVSISQADAATDVATGLAREWRARGWYWHAEPTVEELGETHAD